MKVSSKPSAQSQALAEDRRKHAAGDEHQAASPAAEAAKDAGAVRPLSPAGVGRNFAAVLKEMERRDNSPGDRGEQQQQREEAGGNSRSLSGSEAGGDSPSVTGDRAERADNVTERETGGNSSSSSGEDEGGGDERQAAAQQQAFYPSAVKLPAESVTPVESDHGHRAWLQIAELERIVSAVRTQIFAGGRREVIIDLHRSALDSLRVKITSDREGRLSAEFHAASERVRSEIEARRDELIDALRERGIQLRSLRTRSPDTAEDRGQDRRHEGGAEETFAD
ncbi:MAG TPA: flagellar hook-length control protein FliK [Pyrinomonadaceae bacterium]|nr:flagellar hook-length control protein FliK [Pyrinomonadaceae bacterium]